MGFPFLPFREEGLSLFYHLTYIQSVSQETLSQEILDVAQGIWVSESDTMISWDSSFPITAHGTGGLSLAWPFVSSRLPAQKRPSPERKDCRAEAEFHEMVWVQGSLPPSSHLRLGQRQRASCPTQEVNHQGCIQISTGAEIVHQHPSQSFSFIICFLSMASWRITKALLLHLFIVPIFTVICWRVRN